VNEDLIGFGDLVRIHGVLVVLVSPQMVPSVVVSPAPRVILASAVMLVPEAAFLEAMSRPTGRNPTLATAWSTGTDVVVDLLKLPTLYFPPFKAR